MTFIPLHEPSITKEEVEGLIDSLETGWLSTAGPAVSAFEDAIKSRMNARFAVACNSGTSALHLAMLAHDIRPGDIVIVPDITFVATANAISYAGAELVFVDVDRDGWQIDLDLLEGWLEKNTEPDETGARHTTSGKLVKAIVPVDVMGSVANVERLKSIAGQYNLSLIEDAAESVGSAYDGKPAGNLLDSGIISFNGNKIITTGAGGMYITDDEERANRVRHLSTTAKTDGYRFVHDMVGYNYRMVNILASVGLSQLNRLDEILATKGAIHQRYQELLQDSPLTFQSHDPKCDWNYWMISATLSNADEVHDVLWKEKIDSRTLWAPMHGLAMHAKCEFVTENNVSDYLWRHSLSLPSSATLSLDQVDRICGLIKNTVRA